jgi:hypothetical protein
METTLSTKERAEVERYLAELPRFIWIPRHIIDDSGKKLWAPVIRLGCSEAELRDQLVTVPTSSATVVDWRAADFIEPTALAMWMRLAAERLRVPDDEPLVPRLREFFSAVREATPGPEEDGDGQK